MRLKLKRKWPLYSFTVIVVIFLLYLIGFRFNYTASMPIGIYLQKSADQIKRGDYVFACLPKSLEELGKSRSYISTGECPGGYTPLVKEVIAVPGDDVELSDQAIIVNGRSHVAPVKNLDEAGRAMNPIARGSYPLTDGYWLYGFHDPIHSWDSRYYGPVSKNNIIGRAIPFLTAN
jgi:conjugative transfer signal peptidase TraF